MSAERVTVMDVGGDDPVIGKRFRGWDGKIYLCEWWDKACGYEMVEVSPKPMSVKPLLGGNRTNVSERAIGRTFHRTHDDDE